MSKCPHKDYCKQVDGCPPEEEYWLNCWAYRSIEGMIDMQVFRSKMLKKRFRDVDRMNGEDI